MLDLWNGNSQVFRTYIKGNPSGDGKSPSVPKGSKLKGKDFLTYKEAEKNPCFGGVLQSGIIDISFDTDELSQIFWDMSEQNHWSCLILENPSNGHIHSFWKIPDKWDSKDGKDKKLAVGLIADVHSGDTYIPLRVHDTDRFPPLFEPDQIDPVPEELFPVNTSLNLLDLKEGSGRNEELFKYILVLQGQLGLSKETIIRILDNTNQYVFSDPLDQNEFDTITREEAFDNPVFFRGKTFLHNVFGNYLISQNHIVKIDGKIHVYLEGTYNHDLNQIERMMQKVIPTLTDAKRKETLKYLSVMCEEVTPAPPNLIAFRNGVLDLNTGKLLSFSPDLVITNKIPWCYNLSAYDELADHTLNKMSCGDPAIRSLLEECIGYTFYRVNSIRKAFILTGSGSNGKSTFIAMLNNILGDDNVSAMDLKNLGDRFSKATLFKKLANIGDDISDEFIPDPSLFKKIVSGDRIQAEYKGQDAFEFNPYVKLVFSANSIPRMKDKTGAVINRLVIIPFKAVFSDTDPDFDPDIKRKLCSPASTEYLIRIGVEGLQRVLKNKRFTKSSKVEKELEEYEEYNNPVVGFFKEQDQDYIFRHTTKEIHLAYSSYCHDNGYLPESSNQFGRTVKAMFNVESKTKTINSKSVRMYVKITDD